MSTRQADSPTSIDTWAECDNDAFLIDGTETDCGYEGPVEAWIGASYDDDMTFICPRCGTERTTRRTFQ